MGPWLGLASMALCWASGWAIDWELARAVDAVHPREKAVDHDLLVVVVRLRLGLGGLLKRVVVENVEEVVPAVPDPEAFHEGAPFMEGGEEDEWEDWLDWDRFPGIEVS